MTTGGSSKALKAVQALYRTTDIPRYGSRLKAGTTLLVWRQSSVPKFYASPIVSNIAALMASAADLPAQTTNWNA